MKRYIAELAISPGRLARADGSHQFVPLAAPRRSRTESASRRRGFSVDPGGLRPSRSTAPPADRRRVARIVQPCAAGGCGQNGGKCFRHLAIERDDISQSELGLEFLEGDYLAACNLRLAFANRGPIRIAQRLIGPAFCKKMQKSFGERQVGLWHQLDQTVQFIGSSHVSIVDRKAVQAHLAPPRCSRPYPLNGGRGHDLIPEIPAEFHHLLRRHSGVDGGSHDIFIISRANRCGTTGSRGHE